MDDVTNELILELAYTNTDWTRTFIISNVSQEEAQGAEARAIAVNESLAAGTDDGLSDFFHSDDYDAGDMEHIIGKLEKIVRMRRVITTTHIIFPT